MAVNNQIAKRNKAPNITAYLTTEKVTAKINAVVGGKDGSRFIASIVSATTANPALQECDHGSILSAALLGEGLKLSPSPQLGQYYMVPYKDKKTDTTVAQFQLGYKGYIQLAQKSGYYKRLNVVSVKAGELVKFDPYEETIETITIDDEDEREAAETIGYYAMFEYLNGFKKAIYWSKNKMLKHADKYSAAFSLGPYKSYGGKADRVSYADYEAGKVDAKDLWKYSSFWYKDFDGMAHKTMLRQLISKWGIMSIDMQTAFNADMSAVNADGSYNYVDNDDQPGDNTHQGDPEINANGVPADAIDISEQYTPEDEQSDVSNGNTADEFFNK